jgi:MFS family permease
VFFVVTHFAGSGSHIHLLGFAQILIIMGLFCSWCSCAANRPILSEIVPEKHRASILAWNIVLEGSAAAIFGAPLVGLLSEEVFGYVPIDIGVDIQSLAPEVQQKNVQALTYSLLVCVTIPWIICCGLYGALHLTYKHDRHVAALEQDDEDKQVLFADSPTRDVDGHLRPRLKTTFLKCFMIAKNKF